MNAEAPTAVQAEWVARRFHEVYDTLYPRNGEHVDWRDMPEGYRRRLAATFEWMAREGSVAVGPMIGFHQSEDE